MRVKFICFKFSKKLFFIFCMFLIATICFYIQIRNLAKERNYIQNLPALKASDFSISSKQIGIKEKAAEGKVRVLPKESKGFKIIGEIKIPKLNVDKYILEESNNEALKVSVTKLCGPEINEIGNFCIAGHNYNKMLGKIKKLESNDEIILTDIYGHSTSYYVYDNYQTSPKDVSCLDQNTKEKREITLITCTKGAVKRVIVKAREI